MIKFLIIIGTIFLVILLAIKIIRKKIENIIQQIIPKQQSHHKDASANEVLYEKDDIVVLKGEAERKNQSEE